MIKSYEYSAQAIGNKKRKLGIHFLQGHLLPFLEDSGKAFFVYLINTRHNILTYADFSWSPNGDTIATINGESDGVCVAPLIYGNDWESTTCLVGHEAPVEVAVLIYLTIAI